MAEQGAELATAWLRLVPSFEGVTEGVVKQFVPVEKEIADSGDKASKAWSGKLKAGMAIGAGLAAAGVVAGFKKLYDVGATFDDVSDTIAADTGKSGKALDGLTNIAKSVGKEIPTSFDAAGKTVAQVSQRLGLSGGTLKTVSEQYLEAGRALGQEVNVQKSTAALNAFNVQGKDTSKALDVVFGVAQKTGVSMNDLFSGIQRGAPALQQLGFGFDQSAALIGAMDKAGLNSQQVVAGMSKGLVTLAKDGEKPQDAFKRVSGQIQGFIDKGDDAAALNLAGQIFGTRGATQFISALKSGALNMDDLQKAADGTGKGILKTASDTNDFAEKWKIVQNNATAAMEPLATAVFSGLSNALSGLMPTLQGFGDWLGDNTWAIGAFAGVLGGALVTALGIMTAAWVVANAAVLTSPITWTVLAIVAAVALLTAGIILLVTHWSAVTDFITTIWGGFISWLTDTVNGFVAWWNGMWAGFGSWVSDIWSGFIGFIVDTWNGFVGWLQAALADVSARWNAMWSGFGSLVNTVFSAIVGFIVDRATNIVNNIKAFGALISGVWQSIWSGLGWFVETAFSGVIAAVKTPINGVIGLVNSAIRALNKLSVTIPDWVPGVGGQTWGLSLPTIPSLAAGATVKPTPGGTLVRVAEGGKPETIVDTGLVNQLIAQAVDAGSGAGGGNVYIDTIVAPDEDPVVAGRMMGREFVRVMAGSI
jgi:TP901 family phage tail tape measure protein